MHKKISLGVIYYRKYVYTYYSFVTQNVDNGGGIGGWYMVFHEIFNK